MCPADAEGLGTDQISLIDAYLAMYYFIDAYWERGGRRDGSVTLLRHALGPSPDPDDDAVILTGDPASWSDWLNAVGTARASGYPNEL